MEKTTSEDAVRWTKIIYPLVENGPVEIVDLPSFKMVHFPIVFCMFTRGYMPNDHDIPMKSYAGCVLPEAQRLAGAAVEWLKQGKSPTSLSHGWIIHSLQYGPWLFRWFSRCDLHLYRRISQLCFMILEWFNGHWKMGKSLN
jgi:hypothetical protein